MVKYSMPDLALPRHYFLGAIRFLTVLLMLYTFLLSINLLGTSFKLFGSGFAEYIIGMTTNPFVGLMVGIVATSLIQSSSTTTSLVVGMVAGGVLGLHNAIPIIMGANIGTTVTNTLVSLAHLGARDEFKRAFAASIVHDVFNICAVLVIFPLELEFQLIERSATWLERQFDNAGGMHLFNPLKTILEPGVDFVVGALSVLPYHALILLVVALALMFGSLANLVRVIRSLIAEQAERVINRYVFRNDFVGMMLGMLLTIVAQSSSVTTSVVIPMAGTGLIKLKQIYPYTLGANLGTTVTAILAALATQNPVAVTVALCHLIFNLMGILIFYPLKVIPLRLAVWLADFATVAPRRTFLFMLGYAAAHFVPIVLVFVPF